MDAVFGGLVSRSSRVDGVFFAVWLSGISSVDLDFGVLGYRSRCVDGFFFGGLDSRSSRVDGVFGVLLSGFSSLDLDFGVLVSRSSWLDGVFGVFECRISLVDCVFGGCRVKEVGWMVVLQFG